MTRFSATPATATSDPRLSDSEYRTLAAIGTFTDKNGWCRPSQMAIAEMRGVSRKTINQHIKKLADLGYLNVIPRFNEKGAQISNMMQVKFDQAFVPAEHAETDTPVTPRRYTPLSPLDVTPPVTPRRYTPCNPQDVTQITTIEHYKKNTEEKDKEPAEGLLKSANGAERGIIWPPGFGMEFKKAWATWEIYLESTHNKYLGWQGRDAALEMAGQYTEGQMIALLKMCMAAGWKSIIWDKMPPAEQDNGASAYVGMFQAPQLTFAD